MTQNFTYDTMVQHQLRAVRETESGLILQCSGLKYLFEFISLTAMQEGTIARLTDRGFGFIARKDVEKDIFFHSNELKNVQYNDLRQGDQVTFEITEGPKGLSATNVNRV